MPGLLAVEAESLLQELILFFVDHCIDGSLDGVYVHCIWVSIGGQLCVVPGAFISFLNRLAEVSISVVIVVVAAMVFLLCGLSVSVDLVVLDGFGEPAVSVNGTSYCECIFKGVEFFNVGKDFHGKVNSCTMRGESVILACAFKILNSLMTSSAICPFYFMVSSFLSDSSFSFSFAKLALKLLMRLSTLGHL